MSCRFVFLGLSITSSWGNGHATTYRALAKGLAARGHDVTFLERDVPWYAQNRDMPAPAYARTQLYGSLEELKDTYAAIVREADLVVVGSYVPDGIAVGAWVQDTTPRAAFYDIDTPVTLAALERGTCEYLAASQIPKYALYLSFTGGPALSEIENRWGSPCARALYCAVDPDAYAPVMNVIPDWDLGYLGTYSADRQGALERLFIKPARSLRDARFVVAGAQYPETLAWPDNVERVVHLPPAAHRSFYARQRFTLNVTRAAMLRAGYSPSVRIFEAAACGTPIITDRWAGLDELLRPGEEVFVCDTTADVVRVLQSVDERARRRVAEAARKKILAAHTSSHRAEALERYTRELFGRSHSPSRSILQVNP